MDQEQRASVRELPPEAPVDAFELTDALRRWAHSTHPGLDLEFETDQFRRYYRSTGAERRSWPAAWQKWIADSHKRITQARASPPRLSTTDQRVAQAEALKAELRNGAR